MRFQTGVPLTQYSYLDGLHVMLMITKPVRASNHSQDVKKLLFGKTELDIDHSLIKKKRDELIAQRGKKTIDPSDNIEHFKLLIQLSKEAELGVGIEVMLNVDILSSQFDYTTFASCMKDDVWSRLVGSKNVER